MDIDKITEELLAETDTDRTKQLVDIFNLNIKKKAIVRANKYSDLLDDVAAQLEERIKKVPDQFSNKDLLDYISTLQNVIDKSAANTVDNLPAIQLTSNTVNVNITNSLNRESREKVQEALRAILNGTNTNEVIDINNYERVEVSPDEGEPSTEVITNEVLQRDPEEEL